MGCNIVGLSDNSNETTSAFALMLNGVFSLYKDVVHAMPTKCLKTENLFDIIKYLIIGSKKIGFQVLSIITINKNTICLFCRPQSLSIVYLHLIMNSRFLFFLFDSVHISKYIRNNWFGQKDASKCMLLPKFCHNGNQKLDSILSASFCTLHKLLVLE